MKNSVTNLPKATKVVLALALVLLVFDLLVAIISWGFGYPVRTADVFILGVKVIAEIAMLKLWRPAYYLRGTIALLAALAILLYALSYKPGLFPLPANPGSSGNWFITVWCRLLIEEIAIGLMLYVQRNPSFFSEVYESKGLAGGRE